MNVTENYMLQQIAQMAANMAGSLPQTGGAGKDQSFQDMMVQAGQDSAAKDTGKDTGETQQPAQEKPAEDAKAPEKPQTQKPEKDAAKAQEASGDPNAMQYAVDLFRPEIVDVSQEAAAAEAPVELVAAVETAETAETVEVPVEQLPQTAGGEEAQLPEIAADIPEEEVQAPVQHQEAEPVRQEGAVQESAPEAQATRQVQETAEAPQTREAAPQETAETVEVREAPRTSGGKPEDEAGDAPEGEAAELREQPLFRGAESAPVKVAERYETVDTRSPDMDSQMASAIRQAADDGAQRIQLTLNPANLGQVTVEMTRSASGVLEVALHVVSGKAEQLLGQHLDGLHAALAAYGQGQEVKVEVQRSQETPQQQSQQDQHQANPDGHNRNQQQHQDRQDRRQRQAEHAGDFLQRLRLGLFETGSL